MTYEELVQSNWGFISQESQNKIRSARIFLAGCGLGSNIALLAARTGFTNFLLADGDKVSPGNLNRQAFRIEHINKNKAEVTAELIKEINPEANIEIFPKFISNYGEVQSMVSRSDIVVNLVDPGLVLFQIHNEAVRQHKPSLFPLNLGFGGMVLIFTEKSQSIEQIISPDTAPEDFFFNLALKMEPYLPGYLKQFIALNNEAQKSGLSLPQLGIAVNINSSLTVTAMIKLVSGLPIELAPIPLTMDSWQTPRYKSD